MIRSHADELSTPSYQIEVTKDTLGKSEDQELNSHQLVERLSI